jgi:YbgC/YbaW family acyl-CoA thioester hydrolase
MNLWLRLCWLWLVGRRRAPVPVLGPCRTPFRVSLFDLDVFRHMNNGRYLTILDLARVDLMQRSGLMTRLTAAGFFPVVVAESITFQKALNWRDRFEIETRVVGWDAKSLTVSQRFHRNGVEVASALVRARFLRRSGGSVPTAEVIALTGEDLVHPPTGERLAAWMALHEAGIPSPE